MCIYVPTGIAGYFGKRGSHTRHRIQISSPHMTYFARKSTESIGLSQLSYAKALL
jgi:hypothetical protein